MTKNGKKLVSCSSKMHVFVTPFLLEAFFFYNDSKSAKVAHKSYAGYFRGKN